MAAWVPDDRDLLMQAPADLARIFADAEARLTKMLALQVRAGLTADPDDMAKALRLAALRDGARQMVEELQAVTAEQVAQIVAAGASAGSLAALREMSALLGMDDLTAGYAPAGTMATQALIMDLTSALEDATRRILRWPDDVYRQVIAGPASDILLGLGATTRTAQAAAWQALVSRGVTGFVDKAGRRWNLATYVEMATRTATRRAWASQHEATMLEAGLDLVSIIVGSDACRLCAQWAGKVLRLTPGPTGRVRLLSVVADECVEVDIAGTIEDARDAGWDHPNDRCRQVAFLPGLSVAADATTYSPELEAEREQLRALERDVRKAKGEAAGALNPGDQKAASKKVRALQEQIRAHVKDTGLIRKPRREQVNLGNINIPEHGPRGPVLAVGDRIDITPGATRRGAAPTPPSYNHLERESLIAPPATPGAHYDHAAERATALRLRMLGVETISVKVQTTDGRTTPDAVIPGARKTVEYKTIESPTVNAITMSVRKARQQSRHVVIDGVPSRLTRQTAIDGLTSAVRSYGLDVDEILILLSQGPAVRWTRE